MSSPNIRWIYSQCRYQYRKYLMANKCPLFYLEKNRNQIIAYAGEKGWIQLLRIFSSDKTIWYSCLPLVNSLAWTFVHAPIWSLQSVRTKRNKAKKVNIRRKPAKFCSNSTSNNKRNKTLLKQMHYNTYTYLCISLRGSQPLR